MPADMEAREKILETRQTVPPPAQPPQGNDNAAERKRAMIEAALARSRAQREKQP
jgi:hypothetical protein